MIHPDARLGGRVRLGISRFVPRVIEVLVFDNRFDIFNGVKDIMMPG